MHTFIQTQQAKPKIKKSVSTKSICKHCSSEQYSPLQPFNTFKFLYFIVFIARLPWALLPSTYGVRPTDWEPVLETTERTQKGRKQASQSYQVTQPQGLNRKGKDHLGHGPNQQGLKKIKRRWCTIIRDIVQEMRYGATSLSYTE